MTQIMEEVQTDPGRSIDLSRSKIAELRGSARSSGSGIGVALCILDALIILAAGSLAYSLLGRPLRLVPNDLHPLRLLSFLVCYAVLIVICNAAQSIYSASNLHSGQFSHASVLKGFLLSSPFLIVVFFLGDPGSAFRLVMGATMILGLGGLLTLRQAMQWHDLKCIERGIGAQRVIVVGAGVTGLAFQQYLENKRQGRELFCGFVDETRRSGAHWLGTPEELPRIVKEYLIDEIYFTPEISPEVIREVADQARQKPMAIRAIPNLHLDLPHADGMTQIGNLAVLELSHQGIPSIGLFLKRLMDLVYVSILGFATAPLMLATALAIKLDSSGPIFYTAWRVGQRGRRFRCFKFRTMIADADAHKDNLRHMNERNGATFKIANDPRITRIGRFLRKYSIDELPQLFNVLRGEMSMVGPRPHPVDDYNQYQLEDLRRLDVLPGITGLWQVSARRDPSFEKNVSLDLEYIENWNFMLDLKIVLRTIPEVFRGSGH